MWDEKGSPRANPLIICNRSGEVGVGGQGVGGRLNEN